MSYDCCKDEKKKNSVEAELGIPDKMEAWP